MSEVVSKFASAEPILFTAIFSTLFGGVKFAFPDSDTSL
jgi:hypothetical protein